MNNNDEMTNIAINMIIDDRVKKGIITEEDAEDLKTMIKEENNKENEYKNIFLDGLESVLPDLANLFLPKLKIRYHREMFPDLKECESHGNFVDLYTAEQTILNAGESGLINLGISVQCPEGYWMQLVPRSSTYKNFKIIQTNSFGVIDTSYCGDNDIVKLPVYALKDTVIPANTRICQFRLVKDEPFNIVSVDSLSENTDRGGFGSSGTE